MLVIIPESSPPDRFLIGPDGLVLATPLKVCLVVLGRHVERLAFLDVIFGDRPALSPAEIFYQRMLAGDPTEAAEKKPRSSSKNVRFPHTMMTWQSRDCS
jgi:hypothetical protein